jgi:ABC-2 type transport system permease protein
MLMGVAFAVVVPLLLVVIEVRSVAANVSGGDAALGATLAFNLLIVGLLPTVSAVGIASGQFAGEKERGILTPLLASPASNLAIVGGKVLGAIIPPLTYSVVAEVVYLLSLALFFGPTELLLLPPAPSLAMVALVPLVTCFAATVSSLISSRVRTYNAAQQLGGLVLMPVWGVVVALAADLLDWGPVGLLGAVLALLLLDLVLAMVAAATWRREEVLSQS